jgi:histidyl-tRNA synthetase
MWRLRINDRVLLESLLVDLVKVPPAEVRAVSRLIDRWEKLTPDVLAADAAELGLSDAQFDRLRTALGSGTALLDELPAEVLERSTLVPVLRTVPELVSYDPLIVRGLDYYTGTVFETRMTGYESLGSICSGGRYDSLASDGKVTFPGVGISLGVTRLLMPLFQQGVLDADRSVPSVVLVALPTDADRERCTRIAQILRSRAIATEVAPAAQKYGKQIRYAERRGIPFVWFPSNSEDGDEAADEVKDIRSGEQVAADPASWMPPFEDLRPQVISTMNKEDQ